MSSSSSSSRCSLRRVGANRSGRTSGDFSATAALRPWMATSRPFGALGTGDLSWGPGRWGGSASFSQKAAGQPSGGAGFFLKYGTGGSYRRPPPPPPHLQGPGVPEGYRHPADTQPPDKGCRLSKFGSGLLATGREGPVDAHPPRVLGTAGGGGFRGQNRDKKGNREQVSTKKGVK